MIIHVLHCLHWVVYGYCAGNSKRFKTRYHQLIYPLSERAEDAIRSDFFPVRVDYSHSSGAPVLSVLARR